MEGSYGVGVRRREFLFLACVPLALRGRDGSKNPMNPATPSPYQYRRPLPGLVKCRRPLPGRTRGLDLGLDLCIGLYV